MVKQGGQGRAAPKTAEPQAEGAVPLCGQVARSALPGRDDMALWTGLLAAHRGGFLKHVLGGEHTVDWLLEQTPATVRAAAPVSRVDAGDAEESRFRRVLAAGPACVAAELGPLDGVTTLLWDDPLYPPALREVRDAPPALFVRGGSAAFLRELGERPVVAIVGSRRPSLYGREMARLLARDLTRAGVLVASGMAMGVDAVAQAEAEETAQEAAAQLPADPPSPPHCSTVAVLGCGIRLSYPRENERLARRILRTGLLVSEFPDSLPALPWRFPARNRVIAGLARALVVVEGSERSGSLITAAYATELGRDVLAVPGEAGRRLAAGPHKLMRQGAHLCEAASDVLEAIGLGDSGWSTVRTPGLPVAGPLGVILDELDAGERTVDQLAAAVSASAAEVGALLGRLEIDGRVCRTGNGRYRLRRG